MNIAFVSDIHGNLAALEAVMADMEGRKVDAVVNLGDSFSGPLLPRETADLLMSTGWLHLAGNHERQILGCDAGLGEAADQFARARLTDRHLQWIAALAPSAWLNDEVYVCHASPRSDVIPLLESLHAGDFVLAPLAEISARLADVSASLIACGHTHTPRAVRSAVGQTVVNPGSVGQPAFFGDDPVPYRAQTGSPAARYALACSGGADWAVELIAVNYDHLSMARLARENGRSDWAYILTTGYAREERG
jgi:predicted phosphodiesterase